MNYFYPFVLYLTHIFTSDFYTFVLYLSHTFTGDESNDVPNFSWSLQRVRDIVNFLLNLPLPLPLTKKEFKLK